MDTNRGKTQSLISFTFVATLTAFIRGLLYIIPRAIEYPPSKVELIILFEFITLAITTFLTNLIVPVAKNFRMGILITLPTIGVLLYFYQIRPFLDYVYPEGWLANFYYIITVACIFGPIFEILESICIVIFSWLGALTNIKLFHKSN